MAVVWQPDLTIRPGGALGSWGADTGGFRATLAGWRTGKPTSVFQHPSGARFSWSGDGASWEMDDGSLVPFAAPAVANEEQTDDNRMLARGGMGGGIDEEYLTEGGRLKHTWILPSPLNVPTGARRLLLQGRAFPFGCAFPSATGRTAGSIRLYAPSGEELMSVVRGDAVDEAGNRTHVVYDWKTVGTTGKVMLTVAVDADWLRVAKGRVRVDPTVVSATVTDLQRGPTGRKIARFANGVLLATYSATNGVVSAAYSADNGQSWTTAGAITAADGSTRPVESAVRIAPDDSVFVTAWADSSVLKGVPNAARTSYTWYGGGASYRWTGNADASVYYDMEVVQDTNGDHYAAAAFSGTGTFGTLAFRWCKFLAGATTGTFSTPVQLFAGVACSPSVIQDAQRNLGVLYSTNATGAGKGLRFRPITFTSGSGFTVGTEEPVDEAVAPNNSLCLAVDNQGRYVAVYRDANGKLAVKRRASASNWGVLGVISSLAVVGANGIGAACDGADVYVWYTAADVTNTYVRMVKYNATANTWSSPTDMFSEAGTTIKNITCHPTNAGGRTRALFQSGTTGAYRVTSVDAVLNAPPQEPTITLANSAFAATVGTDITITHRDTDQMGAWTLKRVYGTITEWWNNTTKAFDKVTEFWNAGSGFVYTIPAADNAGDWADGNIYQLYAATKDSQISAGPYNATAVRANVGAIPVVTITSAATSNSASYLVEWTCDRAQGAYQGRVLDGTTQVWTSGKVSDTSARALSATLATNAKTYTVEVTVWDQTGGSGVASAPTTKGVATSFTAAPAPTATASANSAGGFIGVSWTNPAGGTAVSYNDLYRRKQGGVFKRIATQLPANGTYPDYAVASCVTYEYKATAVGTNATTTDSTFASASVTFANGLWLHDPLDPVGSAHFFQYREVNLSDTPKLVSGDFQFVGRTYPTTRFDAKAQTRDIKLRVAALDGTTDRTSLEGLLYRRTTLCLRDFKGRKVWGVVKELPGQDAKGVAWLDLNFNATDYKEEIG